MKYIEYECDSCFTQMGVFTGFPGYYQIESNQRMFAPSEPVWCFDCHRIRIAESLPDNDAAVNEIERCRLRKATRSELESVLEIERYGGAFSLDDYFASRIQWLELCVRFMGFRTNNRCIACGGTSIDYLDTDDFGRTPERIPHPHCDGTLVRIEPAENEILSPSHYFLLDRNGMLLTDYPA